MRRDPFDGLLPTDIDTEAIAETIKKLKESSTEIVERGGRRFEVTVTPPSFATVYDQDERIHERELPPIVPNFECPICASEKFEIKYSTPDTFRTNCGMSEVVGPGQPGPKITTQIISGYFCPGCSTIFTDPVRFSKNRPAQ